MLKYTKISLPSCLPSAANTMLGIYYTCEALCCSEHGCCAVECSVACCTAQQTAIATLTISTMSREDVGMCAIVVCCYRQLYYYPQYPLYYVQYCKRLHSNVEMHSIIVLLVFKVRALYKGPGFEQRDRTISSLIGLLVCN